MGENATQPVEDEIKQTRERIDAKVDELAERFPSAEALKNPAVLAAGGVVAGALGLWVKARLRNRKIRRIALEVIEEVDRERVDAAVRTLIRPSASSDSP